MSQRPPTGTTGPRRPLHRKALWGLGIALVGFVAGPSAVWSQMPTTPRPPAAGAPRRPVVPPPRILDSRVTRTQATLPPLPGVAEGVPAPPLPSPPGQATLPTPIDDPTGIPGAVLPPTVGGPIVQPGPFSPAFVPPFPAMTGPPPSTDAVPFPDRDDLVLRPVSEVETPAELDLFINRARLFHVKPFRRVVIDNPSIVEIQVIGLEQGPMVANPNTPVAPAEINVPNGAQGNADFPRYLNLYGRSFGTATLTVFDADDKPQSYRVRVTIDTKDLESRVNRVFPGADVRVRQIAQQIILEGQVPDSQMMAQVLELIQSELRLSGQVDVGSLSSSLGFGGRAGGSGAGGTTQSVSLNNTQIPADAGGVAGAQPGLILVNRIRLPGPRQIQLRVKLAELDRSAIRQIGANWQRITDGDTIGSIIGNIASSNPETGVFSGDPARTQLFGVFDEGNFSLFINALRENRLARILAEPNLVTMEGQPARFLAGGQFPYPVPQASNGLGGNVITIQFRNYGAVLEFLPYIQEDGSIRLDVEPIFSELDYANAVTVSGTTVPALTERGARTVVTLREGQTLALAGLIQTRTRGTVRRIPLLGDTPIVGPLFSRNEIQTDETELLVLVTPELVEPVDADKAPLAPGEDYMEPNDYEFFFLGRLEGRTGHPHRATIQYLDPFEIMKHFESEQHWVVGPHGHAD